MPVHGHGAAGAAADTRRRCYGGLKLVRVRRTMLLLLASSAVTENYWY